MFDKEKKYFPIKKDPACQLKWTWSSLWLTRGETNSCHRCKRVPLSLENFDEFHNHKFKIKERKIMLSGKWPTLENGGSGHCNFCKKIEDNGGISDRLQHLTQPNLYPDELDVDENATQVTPKILEVFLNNTCNMKCTYCNTHESSLINKEVKEFGPITDLDGNEIYGYETSNKHKNHKDFFYKTLQWIEKHGHKLRRLNLLGGETFYQKELTELLEKLAKLTNPNLELCIVSNLMVKEEKYKSMIEKIKKLVRDRRIGRLEITASIDGWGKEAEYVRSGLDCEHFYRLFEYTAKEKWITLHTNQTITSLTIRSMPQLFEILKDFQKVRKIETQFSLVVHRDWMLPGVFGREFWKKDFEKIFGLMPSNTKREKTLHAYMSGIYRSMPLEKNKNQIDLLRHYLDQLDKRRGTNWKTVYPYLDI